MRQRLFLFALLIAIFAVTAALAPLGAAISMRNRAGDRGRRIVSGTRRRLVAAGVKIVRRIRAVTA
jgi:hypothetical protein